MHEVDQTSDQLISQILPMIERRLRLDPVPLDGHRRSATELDAALGGLISEHGRPAEDVLDAYVGVIAPSVLSADSPGFLGFIPAAPSKASLAFDALLSSASLQGISWLEASGAIAAENTVLALIAQEMGLPRDAGGCFVSGGSAGNLSALAVARETCRRRHGGGRGEGPYRVIVGAQTHPSILKTVRLLDLEPLVVDGTDDVLTAEDVRVAVDRASCADEVVAVVATAGTTNAGIIDELAPLGLLAREHRWWFHIDAAYGGAGVFAPSVKDRFAGIELADSVIIDPHKWLFAPYDSCALLYREPALARHTHTQHASYLDPIHERDGEWNPADYAYHLTRRARGLPLWFSFAVNGVGAYRQAIERTLRLARDAADLIKGSSLLELVREPELGIVLFRRRGWQDRDYSAWAERLHRTGVAFLPPTSWAGETVARLAFVHPNTTLELVQQILDEAVAPP